jgi:hypothetical protein
MHLSHLFIDLDRWYNTAGFDYAARVRRMFSPRATAADGTVTLPNGPKQVSSIDDAEANAETGELGHNATLQQATRLPIDIVDNYGRLRRREPRFPYGKTSTRLTIPSPGQPIPHGTL